MQEAAIWGAEVKEESSCQDRHQGNDRNRAFESGRGTLMYGTEHRSITFDVQGSDQKIHSFCDVHMRTSS